MPCQWYYPRIKILTCCTPLNFYGPSLIIISRIDSFNTPIGSCKSWNCYSSLKSKRLFSISVMNDMTKMILCTSVLTKHQFCFYGHTVQAKTPSKYTPCLSPSAPAPHNYSIVFGLPCGDRNSQEKLKTKVKPGSLGPRDDVPTTCKAVTLRGGQRITAVHFSQSIKIFQRREANQQRK